MPRRNNWKGNLTKAHGPNGGGYDGRRSQGGGAGASGSMIHCFGCNTEKTRNHFSANQLAKMAQKKRQPLCIQCSGGGGPSSSSPSSYASSNAGTDRSMSSPAPSRSSNGHSTPVPTQMCSYCLLMKPKSGFNPTQWKKREHGTCQDCMDNFEKEADADHIHNLTAEKYTYDPDVDISMLPQAAQVAHANKRSLRRVRPGNSAMLDVSGDTRTYDRKGSREKTPAIKAAVKKRETKSSSYDSDFAEGEDYNDYGVFGYGNDSSFYLDTIGTGYSDDKSDKDSSDHVRTFNRNHRFNDAYQQKEPRPAYVPRSNYGRQLIDDDGFDDYH
ncbi:hypothetical protein SYNPS1DRAFT_21752 [Syncephalis pseudoplumigaleata]|uniref:Uncharacterized protein n=1 Tax=Syncephalis pseudoplumigaleata TaxID=1712513 RepID=A0A4P9Z1W9_9FUNG|nr:hypothetical protein SYNPS1DRAFT_21752 [Syncephalis pseudoplumigaleata]|eukprot:RKP26497.1 hypothetical protein SYNPS1DRAFT_21752 [Syncephalis pseudoplumigaleata]